MSKIHAVDHINNISRNYTFCGKECAKVIMAANVNEVTCKICLNKIDNG